MRGSVTTNQQRCSRPHGLKATLVMLLVVICSNPASAGGAMTDQPVVEAGREFEPGKVKMIKPYIAEYEIFRRGSNLGSGVRRFERTDNGEWSFSYHTKMSFLFLSDKRKEQSGFELLIEPEPTIESRHFRFERSGTGDDINTVVTFEGDGQVQRVRNGEQPIGLRIDSPHFDQLNYQLQLQWDLLRGVPMTEKYLSYAVIDRKARTKQYRFRYLYSETLSLPFGEVQAVKLTRVTDNPNRETFIWMAPELDFSLVRLMQIEDEKENYDVKLASFSFISK